jgi:molybdopterin-containing oxidoreductase family iron-sulfur binding subunit
VLRGAGDLALIVYPSGALYDGRGANKAWLQELPDPTTKLVWDSWVEMHPETAARIGVKNGDPVKVTTEAGSLEVAAYLYPGIRRDAIAIPLGQGHTAYGRYATNRGVNPLVLLPPAQDAASGAVAYLSTRAKIEKGTARVNWATTQHEKTQADRGYAQIIPVAALLGGAAAHAEAGAHAELEPHLGTPSMTRPGTATEPLARPQGEEPPAHSVSPFVPENTVRGPRREPIKTGMYDPKHGRRRWAMAIDLNACTGCASCVVACHAENNVPMVGPELIKRGREMHWLRIERFEESIGGGPNDVRFVPMMCQQCSDAPCEVVCPVYATYHNPEGLNAQIYNRCVGTRYCSNNCPYKVRSFNFFDYSAPEKATFAFPEPLNWQLNPDVTVRSKGVMEKCTFCVQRILEGRGNAQDEDRPLRDGEVVTACQQTCPTRAIVFGDLLDPNSAVAKASQDGRRYWVLEELNTKPAITYRKKIARDTA